MAGASETVTIGALEEWARRLGGVTFDFTPALNLCRKAIESSVLENFRGSHAPNGTPWLPLKRPRPNSKGSDKPLRNKGILMGSVTSRSAPGHYEKVTPGTLEYGSNLNYAATHQYGATIFPQASKYLAIPLTKEAANTSGPRAWAGAELKFRPFGRDRGGFMYEKKPAKRGKASAAINHYLLVSSVTIPARPFLGFGEDLINEIGEIFADSVAKAIMRMRIGGNDRSISA